MTRMKESSIDWIGQIPEEWEVTRIKNFVSIERGASPRPIDKFISDDGTGVNWIRIGDTYKGNKYITSTKLKITNRGKQFSRYIHPGTLILSNSMSFGEPYISSIYGCIHDGWLSLAPFNNISKEYLYWLLLSEVCTSQFNLVSIGAVVENLSVDKVGNTLIPIPYSLSEQQKIADFLDKKTTQLDKVKSLLEEQIQKLKDYRASLIYETVTKGLDKAVPMKDSGIDWIGQVPQGWGVKPIKHVVATPVTDGPHETPLLCETGIPFLSAEAVKNGVLDFNYKRGYISLQDHERFKKKISPKKDDIFIVKSGATTGNVGIVNTDEIFDIWSPLALIRCKKSLAVQKYIYYYLISNIFKAQVEFNWSFGTQQNIGMGIIENIKLILPPLSEQTKISDFLDKKTVQIDQLIQIKNKQIKNINKQRQTLIYDYVTGKRRV